ncbi:Lrp/AsnC ligand binding domain-containing protein [Calothrix rhizosoleniae]|uniref:nSTAND1 domain-containing NTPase n=1 Tax=Calothrix rhizosoleniae TaxID=888997 RepID=UPI000B4A38F6|nr:Lrp/AsnC ligand binding domain-containing protein [Calothrix rhizosoleniae]
MSDFRPNDDITAYNQQSLESLKRAIILSNQNFALILASCNYRNLSQHIFQQLKQICAIETQDLTLDTSAITLYTAIQSKLEHQQPEALIVFGLDSLHDIDKVLASTNNVREEFRKNFSFPIVLSVTKTIAKKLTRLAPDFESWTTKFEFELTNDELIKIIKQSTDKCFAKVLDIGARKFIPPSIILEAITCQEIESAQRDLQNRGIELQPELQAKLNFVLGLRAYANNQMEQSRQFFEQSLIFWQNNNRRKPQGCVLYYLGLWWRRYAFLHQSEYETACIQAQRYFQLCIDVLEQGERPDLAAKFINALGEVLQRRKDWEKLATVARKAINLHKTYPDPIRLAYSYGLLAEFLLESKDFVETEKIVNKALQIINSTEVNNLIQEDIYLQRECQNHQGWYLLLLAYLQKEQEQNKEAIANLKKAEKIGSVLESRLYINILDNLRHIYFIEKEYREAFNIKRKQYSIEHQYGLRAFIGPGYLQNIREEDWFVNGVLEKKHLANIISLEIQASGRDQDIKKLIQRINHHHCKLIVIYGPSGVGKSSLINVGLIPALEAKGTIRGQLIFPPILIRKYSNGRWIQDINQSLIDNIKKLRLDQDINVSASPISLESIIEQLKINKDLKLVTILIFDQLEELFFVCKQKVEKFKFYDFLQAALRIPSVKIILSMRQDYWHYLLELTRMPQMNVISNHILSKDSLYYLGNFSKENAKSVIHALRQKSQPPLDRELVNKLVEDLADELGEIHPIELQIVGAQLEEAQLEGSKITTIDRYLTRGVDAKSRIKNLVQLWLGRVIKDCGYDNEDVAWKVLYKLTHENIRTIKSINELVIASSATSSKLRSKQIKLILRVFVDSGLVLKLREDTKDYYQLVHDYLVSYIRDEHSRRFDEIRQKVDKLRKQLSEKDLFKKINAVIQIGELGNLQGVELLKNILEKEGLVPIGLRWHILKALSQIKGYESIGLIIQNGLNDKREPVIQAHAANLLGQLKVKRAKDILLNKCSHDYHCVRFQARWAVTQLGEEVPALKCEESIPSMAYLLIKGNVDTLENDVLQIQQLKSLTPNKNFGIVECGVTYGDFDFLIKVFATNSEYLNEFILETIQNLDWVQSTRTFYVINVPQMYYWKRQPRTQDTKFISYIMIKSTPPLDSASLVVSLMDIPEVSEAAAVYGEFDVIAKIEASSLELRDAILIKKISRTPSVGSTHTYPVLDHPHNSYWDNSENFQLSRESFIVSGE